MNYETTAVYHVVAGNYSEHDYRYWRSRAEEIADDLGYVAAITFLANELESTIEGGIPLDLEQPYLDILTGAFSDVNWREVATVALEEWEGEDADDD
jgi:hypothetical protein